MTSMLLRTVRTGLALAGLTVVAIGAPSSAAGSFPDPRVDEAPSHGSETALLAGGCFWGMEGVFEHVKGVSQVVSGYAGGDHDTATYGEVSTGTTGHAESVRITYDPSQVTYGQLLKVYFAVAHDPTEVDRQGPDVGTQYRSAIFYASPEQRRIAEAYIAQLQAAHMFSRRIATQVRHLKGFYPAEAYHQGYLARHPDQPYIIINDLPKITRLKRELPDLCISN